MEIMEIKNVPTVLEELEKAFFDIPFENSDYQNKMFVVADQITPARAYRAIGLRMFSKIRAVKEYMFGCEEQQVELDEIDYKIEYSGVDQFEKRRLEIKKKRILDSKNWSEKLLNDALRELNLLYSEFQKYPRFTREQFEAEERKHFTLRLDKQASVSNDAHAGLLTMEKDALELDAMREQIKVLLARE